MTPEHEAAHGTTWPLHSLALGDTEVMEDDEILECLAAVHDALRTLRQMETALAGDLGARVGKGKGNLPDGRQYELARTADRKEWDHEDWKRDVRRQVVAHVGEHVLSGHAPADAVILNPETGEALEVNLARVLMEAITLAQEVHGSTAPRSTSLKRLDLYASDYCTSSPGGWRFNAIEPKPDTTTDSSSGEQNG